MSQNQQTAPIGIRAPANYNPTAKQRFRESADNISRHKALLEMHEYERARDFSQLEYLQQVAQSIRDTNSALAAGYKLQAVFEYQNTFQRLHDQATVSPTMMNDNLPSNTR
jgi:hypothetical protein